eukprot:jgi/Ulvmu1/12175/UM085_0039.1
MTDRIRYPPASYPGIGQLGNDVGNAASGRANEIEELRKEIPDCVSVDAQRRTWELPVLLPYPAEAASGAQTVTLELEVPLDYPATNAVLKVTPVIPHVWVDSDTGVLEIQNHTEKTSLKQMVLDGYVAISGSQYVPQGSTTRPGSSKPTARHNPGREAVAWQSLKGQIERKLQSMDDEQLFKLVTDQSAFMQELQSWVKETGAAKQYFQVHKEKVQAAQSNKDLMAEYEGTQQQVRVTRSAEVEPSVLEHDDLLARQAAVVSKVDIDSLIATIQNEAKCMDTGESEKVEITSRGAGSELSQAAISAKIDCYKQKRMAYHAADIKSRAALQLQR